MAHSSPDPAPFQYDTEVPPGEKRHVRYEVGETYLGDPLEIPITVITGSIRGKPCFSAPRFTVMN